MCDELADRVNAWAMSPEGQKSLADTAKRIADLHDHMVFASMISWEQLHKPVDNSTYRHVAVGVAAFQQRVVRSDSA